MSETVRRIFVEKKKGFNIEAENLFWDLKENLGIKSLSGVRILNRYDIAGISAEVYATARNLIFSEPTVDQVYDEDIPHPGTRLFAVEYLPGQYDQRADSAAQCIQLLTQEEPPLVKTAKVIILEGTISDAEFAKIKAYCINPVDSREAALAKPESLDTHAEIPADVPILTDFIHKTPAELQALMDKLGLAMTIEDLEFCQTYFREQEKRDPTLTELRVIDTYWSDHCRHTTFLTEIETVQFEKGQFAQVIAEAYQNYQQARQDVYQDSPKDITLMDIATIAMKELRKQGKLPDLDLSDEINACSIKVTAQVDGVEQEWLVMFKNETHNHPTEIEPFGGAATCLGGAIRDPLSGRVYVYQAMRVTGSGDPRTKIADTLPGKLPQRKITTEAAAGYSSYGNQVGLATGQVAEIYDEGYVAKRMEIGAVIGAAPKENVVRAVPSPGDVIILVGGRTGRDGCGGATGSSKEHTEESLLTCGAEVQKGNPPTERKIQRLFRIPAVSRMIKRCNDFGAGGVCVAIGELAAGLAIDLDTIPRKYEGLDGTELAISESQERMAVVVSPQDSPLFIQYAQQENLEATPVATVTATGRMQMTWRGKVIVDLSRAFLNTNGVKQKTQALVEAPKEEAGFFTQIPNDIDAADLSKAWVANLQNLNVCSQKGLVERFDSTIGAATVLMPFGGKYQATPIEAMVAKLPVLSGETNTATVMSFGYNPRLAKWSPFHSAVYAIVEAVAKVVAVGGDYRRTRLTLQEYFERLGQDPRKWGKPLAALLGAFYAQRKLGIPAIGGKDSMSGTFKDLTVPPTLVAFAVNVVAADRVISPEFKKTNSTVVLVQASRLQDETPDFAALTQNFTQITQLIQAGKVLAAHTIGTGGIAAAISKMCFGNRIGMKFTHALEPHQFFTPDYGSIILEVEAKEDLAQAFGAVNYQILGTTQPEAKITVQGHEFELEMLQRHWEAPLETIFPTKVNTLKTAPVQVAYAQRAKLTASVRIAKPRIFMPIFPGTNCEYDTIKAFTKAGGIVEPFIFKNLSPADIEESVQAMAKLINNAQIIMIPGGFSAGDEPAGSGKFIATTFRNPVIKEAVMLLLQKRDGLILGICNGFQALIKLGLLPYGEIVELTPDSPTLTFNTIGRHVSCMVRTKITSTLSPWLRNVELGEIHTIPISHGEGRFVASEAEMQKLIANGQIATQYVDLDGNPTYDIAFNPNGSMNAVEGITSPDGRVLGKMGHSERIGANVAINVPGVKDQKIFEAGVQYFA